MPTHDIIDNRNEKLVDHIKRILSSTDRARFAVGYFFLSGLTAIAERLAGVKELKLLIGSTTDHKTLEQLAEGYRRLEMVVEAVEAQTFPKRTDAKRMATETAENLRTSVELMDQTDEAETLVKIMVRMIEEKRLKVRVYTKGRMHANCDGDDREKNSPRVRAPICAISLGQLSDPLFDDTLVVVLFLAGGPQLLAVTAEPPALCEMVESAAEKVWLQWFVKGCGAQDIRQHLLGLWVQA